MAVSGIKVTWDERAIRKVTRRANAESTMRAAEATLRRVRQNIATQRRIDTGTMLLSFRVEVVQVTDTTFTATVISRLPYTVYQEFGIGPVYPVHKKFLRFKPKGSRAFVFAKRTSGFPGGHFLRDAYTSIRVRDFTP